MTAVFAFKKDLLTIKIPPTLSSGGIFVVIILLGYVLGSTMTNKYPTNH